MIEPTWQSGNVALYLGNCFEVLPTLAAGSVDAVVTDPPYGMAWDGKVTRGPNGTGKAGPTRNYGCEIVADNRPFDPSPWLAFPRVLLWGMHHFADRLPPGSVLVWLKRKDSGFESFLSDADLAWLKGGCGVYCRRDLTLQGESKNRAHPTQKPVGIMAWCLERAKVPDGGLVLDPFMGSGTTGVACVQTGRKFVGIEIDLGYFEIARKRIEQAQMQMRMDL